MRLIEHFFTLVAPHDCLQCGREGSLACAECREAALSSSESRCYRCNRIVSDSKTCSDCRRQTPLGHVWVRCDYEGLAKKLIHSLKFRYRTEAARLIADELTSVIPYLHPDTVIVPVPTAAARIRQRGLDHTALLARQLSVHTGLRVLPLLRRQDDSRQVGSSRQTRRRQMEKAFRLASLDMHIDFPVLVIDDVVTTRATLEAAAGALRAAGARSIDAAIFARTK